MSRLTAAALVLVAACGDDGSPPDVPADASTSDTGVEVDAGDRDAAAPDAGDVPDAGPTGLEPPYVMLSETGLYEDIVAKRVAGSALPFAPNDELWTDGAVKQRWLFLPEGTTIDTLDPDHWYFPVGTRLFKEFAAPDGTLLETRLIQKIADTGAALDDFWMGAFVWLDDESDAVFMDGADNVRGTEHDVPTQMFCRTCHGGEPGQVLGMAAIQMSGPASVPGIDALDLGGFLSDAPPPRGWPVPGNGRISSALGYLHANCGHCHNENGTARPDTAIILRLSVGERRPPNTAIYMTSVDIANDRFVDATYTTRVVSGDPDASTLLYRMTQRGDRNQMPPLGTEMPDPAGIAAVRTWILSL